MNVVFAELKRVFEDKVYRKAMCDKILKSRGCSYHTQTIKHTTRRWWECPSQHGGCSFSSAVHNVFGRYDCAHYDDWLTKLYGSLMQCKSGIEVLHLRPHAKGTTYSRQCSLTIPDLKKHCGMNGIKPKGKWKKIDYLTALMKV